MEEDSSAKREGGRGKFYFNNKNNDSNTSNNNNNNSSNKKNNTNNKNNKPRAGFEGKKKEGDFLNKK